MASYHRKPVVIEATRWFRNGDHPEDDREAFQTKRGEPFLGDGKVVRYYRNPDIPSCSQCATCRHEMDIHGWIETFEGGHIVCPGDWIITGIMGEHYPCKPHVLEATYEPEGDPDAEIDEAGKDDAPERTARD